MQAYAFSSAALTVQADVRSLPRLAPRSGMTSIVGMRSAFQLLFVFHHYPPRFAVLFKLAATFRASIRVER